jgi:hypothetical protein
MQENSSLRDVDGCLTPESLHGRVLPGKVIISSEHFIVGVTVKLRARRVVYDSRCCEV